MIDPDNRPARELSVTTHDADNDGESGVAAIVRAFVKNPGGAVQIVVFIGSLYALYYTVQDEIKDVRAAQITNFEKLNGKLEALITSDIDQRAKIDAVYARGDTRYTGIIAKLSAHDVDIAEIKTGVNFIVKQYERPSLPKLQ